MIRVGWLPVMWRARRRAANYVRIRRRSPRRSAPRRASEPAPAPFVPDTVEVRTPLPTATLVRGASPASTLLGDVRSWVAMQATWLRPRAIPMAVAFAGMLGVLASVNYLHAMNQPSATASTASRGGVIWIEPAAAGTMAVRR